MNNISLVLLGLALINVPVCLSKSDKQCFSLPDYPCCEGDVIVYSDKSGDWGIENGEWCGIISSDNSCFSTSLGYPCCTGNKVVYTDESGNWGIENGKWCGIDTPKDSCFSFTLGYPCCQSCEVAYTDKSGEWGIENGKWCGIKDECTINPVTNITDFDLSFLKMENNKKNMIYSSLSIKYALKMLEEGANNNTLAEIQNVLGNSEISKYESIDKVLSLADGLFIKNDFYKYVKPEYIDVLKEKYDAEVVKDEFKDANNVNQWIEDKTLGIIKKMLSDKVVQDPMNVMLIINALAIDMEWASQFSYQSTYGEAFYLDSGEKVKATTMSKGEVISKDISYYIDKDITVLNMDLKEYDGVQFEFMAIMPKENLSDYVEKVSMEEINEIDKKLKSSADEEDGVDIYIPKFKFSYDLELKEDLMKLGIKDAFDKEKADLSKIADSDELIQKPYVSDALHKADIEFTEKGVKAAAVTVISVGGLTSPMPEEKYPVEVRINKPFMFVIKEKNTKDIWFTGTVYEPNLWEDESELYEPSPSSGYCFSLYQGYPCCKSCIVLYTESNGDEWGFENDDFCGISKGCSLKPVSDKSDFDFSFLKMENKKENMLYSPLSIKYALKMLEEGADSNTLAEIKNVLGNSGLTKYKSIDEFLSFANGLFIRDTFYNYVKPEYTNTLKEKYNAEVVKDEFKDASNANQWIEDKTLGIIKKMLKDEDVQDPMSVMIIINALAIEMEWAYPFNFRNTYGSYFHYDNGEMKKVTMMSRRAVSNEAISYYIDSNIKVLSMDLKKYNGVQLEFMAIMPEEKLSDYVEKVSKKYLKQIDKRLKSTAEDDGVINLSIPKFKFNYDLELKNDLMNLGIKDVFDKDKADLSKIADSNELTQKPYAANALHKADIVVTEKGVKSAAVSVIIATGAAANVKQSSFVMDIDMDRPFLFVIRDKSTKDIWFTGTVYEPDLWENDMESYGRTF